MKQIKPKKEEKQPQYQLLPIETSPTHSISVGDISIQSSAFTPEVLANILVGLLSLKEVKDYLKGFNDKKQKEKLGIVG